LIPFGIDDPNLLGLDILIHMSLVLTFWVNDCHLLSAYGLFLWVLPSVFNRRKSLFVDADIQEHCEMQVKSASGNPCEAFSVDRLSSTDLRYIWPGGSLLNNGLEDLKNRSSITIVQIKKPILDNSDPAIKFPKESLKINLYN